METYYEFDNHIEIGLAIKKLRMQAGLSQTKLADGICDRTTIVHLEKGRAKQPSIYLLNQLCRRLSITLDDFLNSLSLQDLKFYQLEKMDPHH